MTNKNKLKLLLLKSNTLNDFCNIILNSVKIDIYGCNDDCYKIYNDIVMIGFPVCERNVSPAVSFFASDAYNSFTNIQDIFSEKKYIEHMTLYTTKVSTGLLFINNKFDITFGKLPDVIIDNVFINKSAKSCSSVSLKKAKELFNKPDDIFNYEINKYFNTDDIVSDMFKTI